MPYITKCKLLFTICQVIFTLFNSVYKKYFPKDPPVRTAVAIGNFEKGLCIEIDVIALG